MPQSIADFGVLHRATVRAVDNVAETQAVIVECPTIAPGYSYGPVVSLVPDLAVGERVVLACLGTAISDVIVLQRWTPRWPRIAEVPGLADGLGALATDADLDLLTERVDHTIGRVAESEQTIYELDRSLGYARSKIEELPESFQRQQANVDAVAATAAANASALAAMRTTLYGGPDRSRPPAAFVYWVADSGNLGAGANYHMTSGWAKEDNDPDGMISLGSTNANPTIITAPVTGKYVLEWDAVSNATSGVLYARLLINPDLSASLNTQVANSSVVSQAAGGCPEGTHLHMSVTRNLAAGDRFVGSLYSTVAFVLKAGWFGQLRQTRFGIRYVGPAQT